MSSCHTTTKPVENAGSRSAILTIALAGNPNCGKTTVFNGLTGLRQKVANYPGVTVEKKVGRCRLNDGRTVEVIDLPGTYSLVSHSLDERVAMEVLRGLRLDTRPPDRVIVVVDASNLQRNLYLVSQLIELGRPLVLALNMIDIADRRGLRVSPEALSAELGVPVVPLVGHRRQGISELKDAIDKAAVARAREWRLPESMREELLLIGSGLSILDSENAGSPRTLGDYSTLAERLLIGDTACDLTEMSSRPSVASLIRESIARLKARGIDPMQADIEAHYRWIDTVAAKVAREHAPSRSSGSVECLPAAGLSNETTQASGAVLAAQDSRTFTLTQKVDAVLVHKLWGLLIFAGIMAGLFISMFWLAQPIMDAMQDGVSALGDRITANLTDGPIKSLLVDGVFKGVGAVVVFVPQIAILFCFLAILEDSGYLARAAFLMDRLLGKVGLHGKSFIPLLSSFACAIPGIMATRTIENRRERLATILIAPFMSCSARLPVYSLLIGTFFAAYGALAQAGVMLALYGLGIVAAAGTAFVFKRSFRHGPASSFILELPTYKVPQLTQVLRQVWVNTRQFLTKAGTTIFCLSVILWAMAYYPRLPQNRMDAIAAQIRRGESAAGQTAEDLARKQAAAQSEYSISGRLGHVLEPTLRPLGFDWKIGIGLVSAFAAREVFVSSMGIVYSVGEVDADKAASSNLPAAMKADRYTSDGRLGRPVWTPLVAVSLLVWFVLAMQCMSTLAVVRRETGGWYWPLLMLVFMNALAYLACLAIYQGGLLLFNA